MSFFDVFKKRHQFARDIFYDYLFDEYTEAQLRAIPHESMNTLVWNMWHVARVEDSGVTRFVTGEEQVLKSGNWNAKMNIDIMSFGYGMSRDDMTRLSETINLEGLRGYWNAVIGFTFTALDSLTEDRLEEVITVAERDRILIDEEVGYEHVKEDNPYAGMTRRDALYHFSVLHYYWHGGEVRTIQAWLRSQEA
ncbi:MAG: DinB family protein [Chloroflexota bacterium]